MSSTAAQSDRVNSRTFVTPASSSLTDHGTTRRAILADASGSSLIRIDEEGPADLAQSVDEPLERRWAPPAQREVVRAEKRESAGAETDHLPARLAQQPIFAAIGDFARADVLESVTAGRVVLDRDPQLGEHDVGP